MGNIYIWRCFSVDCWLVHSNIDDVNRADCIQINKPCTCYFDGRIIVKNSKVKYSKNDQNKSVAIIE